MLIRWKNKDKDKEKCDKSAGQKSNSTSAGSKKKRKFGRDGGKSVEIALPFVSFTKIAFVFPKTVEQLLFRARFEESSASTEILKPLIRTLGEQTEKVIERNY